ncbi:CLUMA_CG010465, isoform A [Clunio marinus]|uniref:CLUMA_CG010465, isoform A n=1 Tax=Clunio marinus TaxID=568069 RepID=A0A1J1I9W2_9DIPT|nr:CLUMA_CG010465, isoform A [Clunio marinus]
MTIWNFSILTILKLITQMNHEIDLTVCNYGKRLLNLIKKKKSQPLPFTKKTASGHKRSRSHSICIVSIDEGNVQHRSKQHQACLTIYRWCTISKFDAEKKGLSWSFTTLTLSSVLMFLTLCNFTESLHDNSPKL